MDYKRLSRHSRFEHELNLKSSERAQVSSQSSDSERKLDTARLYRVSLNEVSLLIRFACHELASPLGTVNTAISFLQETNKDMLQKLVSKTLTAEETANYFNQLDTVFSMCMNNNQKSASALSSFRAVAVPMCVDGVAKVELAKFVNQVVVSNHSRLKVFPHRVACDIFATLELTTYIGCFSIVLANLIEYVFTCCLAKENPQEVEISATAEVSGVELRLCHGGYRNLSPEDNINRVETSSSAKIDRYSVGELQALIETELNGRLDLNSPSEVEHQIRMHLPNLPAGI